MRPIELRMSGFTCFRDEIPVSLGGLEVFAIAGATGAGKSSILDAMIFALYGKVPRMGKVGCADLISLGKDRLSVTLKFEIRGRTFVVTRTLRRKGAAEAQLDEGDALLEQGVTDVNRRIERLVGMPYETFLQAVVLPQGDFAKFLQSTGGERTKILRGLLRLDVYEHMRKAASQEEQVLAQGVALLQKQLDTDYAKATPETVTSTEEELAARALQNDEREATIKTQTADVTKLRAMRTRTSDWETAEADRERLGKDEGRIGSLRAELNAAERALQIETLLHEVEMKRKERTARRAERSNAEQAAKVASSTLAQREAERTKAERDAKEVPKLRARVQALDKIMGTIDAASTEREQLAAAQSSLDDASKTLEKMHLDLPKLERASTAAASALDKASERLMKIGYDAKRAAQFEIARKDAQRLGQLRLNLEQKSTDLSTADRRVKTKDRELEGLRDDLEVAQREQTGATSKRKKLEETLRAAHRNDHVRALHDVLVIGASCPVCDQRVKTVPKKPRAQELEDLESRVERAEKDERRAIDACTKIRTKLERVQTDLDEARKETDAARKRFETIQKDTDHAEAALDTKIGKLLTNEPGDTIEARVEAALDTIASAREEHEAALEAKSSAREAATEARDALKAARDNVSQIEAQTKTLISQIETSREKLDKWTSKIRQVTKHPEPHVEREELSARTDTLEGALTTAKESEQTAKAGLKSASDLLEAAKKRSTAAESAAIAAEGEAESAALARSFTGIDGVRAAVRPEPRRKQLRGEVELFDKKLHVLADRIATLERELGETRVSAEELECAEQGLRAINAAHGEAKEQFGVLRQQLDTARQRLEHAGKLQAEVAERSGRRAVFTQLAKDLGSSEFQQFMLRETVLELVARASERLMRLSAERYALVVRDDDFYVIDNDNAGEERPATTLSGGETFLTSLALALELSEQVQRAAGAVRLDSLFVDEGFGTLDPEALNVAAEAILSLQVGGRMVGVITHVPELTRQMPMRLRVRKEAGGTSTIERES
jgi:DNA repair protein SbcC/Rad50